MSAASKIGSNASRLTATFCAVGTHAGRALAWLVWGMLAAAVTVGCHKAPAHVPDVTIDPDEHPTAFFDRPRAKLLILGVFHFEPAGMDSHKPSHSFDPFSPRRQAEIAALLDQLETFAPTKIAVEVKSKQSKLVAQLYADYRATKKATSGNEVVQIGLRLADRMSHTRVYPVDTFGRRYRFRTNPDRAARRYEQQRFVSGEWGALYERYYDWDDEQIDRMTLTEYLVRINSPEMLRRSHGAYFVDGFEVAGGGHFPGADNLTGYWYNRNLRIFANVNQLVENPDERILLIVGVGHVPILQHAADASPVFELVDVHEVLASDSVAAEPPNVAH